MIIYEILITGSGALTLEQLTEDHRLWISEDKSYLSRAMGINARFEIDCSAFQVDWGDIFLFVTDGIYESVDSRFMAKAINDHSDDLDSAAKIISEQAYEQGSTDNLTTQIIRVNELPFPPILEARMDFDGYKVVRKIYSSSRSHVYLVVDDETGKQSVMKTPAVDLQHDSSHLERFLIEEWIARRIDSPHVLKPEVQKRQRHYMYIIMEFIEGQTLTQWMTDNQKPDLEIVRGIIEQIAKGLRAFHRLEMLYQDLRPENIMIDSTGTVKIIDFGSTKVAGIMEISTPIQRANLLGTVQYTAPEYLLGEAGTPRSDLFSLAIITYQMLTGKLPYGVQVAQATNRTAQNKLNYQPMPHDERQIPLWVDGALKKALHPNPTKRYEEISEFLFDLRHPNKAFINQTRPRLSKS